MMFERWACFETIKRIKLFVGTIPIFDISGSDGIYKRLHLQIHRDSKINSADEEFNSLSPCIEWKYPVNRISIAINRQRMIS